MVYHKQRQLPPNNNEEINSFHLQFPQVTQSKTRSIMPSFPSHFGMKEGKEGKRWIPVSSLASSIWSGTWFNKLKSTVLGFSQIRHTLLCVFQLQLIRRSFYILIFFFWFKHSFPVSEWVYLTFKSWTRKQYGWEGSAVVKKSKPDMTHDPLKSPVSNRWIHVIQSGSY